MGKYTNGQCEGTDRFERRGSWREVKDERTLWGKVQSISYTLPLSVRILLTELERSQVVQVLKWSDRIIDLRPSLQLGSMGRQGRGESTCKMVTVPLQEHIFGMGLFRSYRRLPKGH